MECPNCGRDMSKYYARRYNECKICLEGESK